MKFIRKAAVFLALGFCFTVGARAAATVTQIAAGNNFVLFLMSDGSLWTAGYNGDGETGNSITYQRDFPYDQSFPLELVYSNVTAVAAGGNFSLFTKSDGSLWGMGNNISSQLGVNSVLTTIDVPQKIVGSNVVAMSAGGTHTIYRAYTVTGPLGNQTITMLVEGLGEATYGELGNYATKSGDFFPSPVTIEFESTKFFPQVTPGCAAGYTSFYVRTDGTLWGMGQNVVGELGDGITNTPASVVQVFGASNVTAVAANGGTTFFLESDGSLWSTGSDLYGVGGEGTTNGMAYLTAQKIVGSNVVAVSCGASHTLFLKTDGTLWGMGLNSSGELGPNKLFFYFPSPRQIASNVVNFAAGTCTYYTKTDGTTWAAGTDIYGELGDGFANNESTNAEQIFPFPLPVNMRAKLITLTSIQVTATCLVGGYYDLLGNTNMTQPLYMWSIVNSQEVKTSETNNFSAILPIDLSVKQKYFILVRSD